MRELLLHRGERLGELGVDCAVSSLMSDSQVVDGLLQVAPLLAQEGRALAELGALGLGERVDGPDTLAPALEPLDALAQRRRLGLVGRRREAGLVELLADLVERRGELGAAVLEARQRHLGRGAPLAELGRGRWRRPASSLGERAQLAAVERRVGLLDPARGAAMSARGVRAQAP